MHTLHVLLSLTVHFGDTWATPGAKAFLGFSAVEKLPGIRQRSETHALPYEPAPWISVYGTRFVS